MILSCFSNSTKWRKKEGMNGRVNEVKREETINQEKKLATTIAKNTPASTHQEGSHKGEVSSPQSTVAHTGQIFLHFFSMGSRLPILALSIKDFVSLHPMPTTKLASVLIFLSKEGIKKGRKEKELTTAARHPPTHPFSVFSDITNRNRECALSSSTLFEPLLVRQECYQDL